MRRLLVFPLLALPATLALAQTNAAIFPLNFDDGYTILHSNAKIDIRLRNQGSQTITSISYTVEDLNSGAVSSERSTNLSEPIASGEEGYANFRIPAGSTVGTCQKIVTITKVNGEKNEASTVMASANGTIYTLAEKVAKCTIEEEYTGTWCGYCPRGIAGMELLEEDYPDTFIGIAYHYSDPMYISSNGYHEGFPEAILNRHINVDPYDGTSATPYGVEKDFLREQAILPFAALTATATWSDDSRRQIRVDSHLRWVYNSDHTYAMAYFVTEDGMSGSSSSWTQSNYYSNSSYYPNDPGMAYWTSAGSYVSGYKFNHVAVATFGRDNGIVGSVASPVTVGMEDGYSYTLDLSQASTIQDRDHLHVIAALIDTRTEVIVNAVKLTISAYDPSGLEEISADVPAASDARYSLDGRLLNAPAGIYVQRGHKRIQR